MLLLVANGCLQAETITDAFKPNPLLGELMQQVSQTDLVPLMRQLTGEEPVVVGGGVFSITTRCTGSGAPILKATQFTCERLRALGLQAHYQDFEVPGVTNEFEDRPSVSGRNVVAVQLGENHPEQIIVVGTHLDGLPEAGRAPGADDNASGAAAVLNCVTFQTGRCTALAISPRARSLEV